jgi:hypothetical protein
MKLPQSKPGEFQSDIIFAVTGTTKTTKSLLALHKLVPTIYALAVAQTATSLAFNSLRKAGLVKRSYYKHKKRYWNKRSKSK